MEQREKGGFMNDTDAHIRIALFAGCANNRALPGKQQ